MDATFWSAECLMNVYIQMANIAIWKTGTKRKKTK